MSETFLNKAQLTGLTKDARRTEILRAREAATLEARTAALEAQSVAVGWTPVVTQGVAVSITNTQSFYSIMGDWVIGMFAVVITSSGTAGQGVFISLPVAAATVQNNIGLASIYDASTAYRYPGFLDMTSTTQMWLADSTQASGAWALGTVTYTAALVSGDSITGSFRYKWT